MGDRFVSDIQKSTVTPTTGGDESSNFTCAVCGETFEKLRTDEEAMAEAKEKFGDDLGDDLLVVCDDCFRKMTAVLPIEEWRATR